MTTLKAARGFLLPAPSAAGGRRIVSAAAGVHIPARVKTHGISLGAEPALMLVKEFVLQREGENIATARRDQGQPSTSGSCDGDRLVTSKLYAIMEAAADRARMHDAIGAQRDSWNSLLLGAVNSMTLAASAAAGMSAIPVGESTNLAFKASSVLLYSAATAVMLVVNKIQPSQLAEEQRNAARLFRQLEKKIRTVLAVGRRRPTAADVEEAVERVLALDKAYPLSLLPGMLDKFPATVRPTVWWPKLRHRRGNQEKKNGGSESFERLLTGVLRTLKKNDTAEYVKLGKLVLGINTVLAAAGPVLTGLAAVGASLVDAGNQSAWPLLLGVVGGSLATVINTVEHGGQVGMVFELYRNCAGFYRQMEEEIEFRLEEADAGSGDGEELFELQMALQLGRSLPELRSLSSNACSRDEDIREYAGKLF